MAKKKDKDLKNELIEIMKKYNYYDSYTDKWWDNWLKKFIKTMKQRNNLTIKESRDSPKQFKKVVEEFKQEVTSKKYYFHRISQIDVFEDEKNLDFQDFCKDLRPIVEKLRWIEDYLDSLIVKHPQGSSGRKKNSFLYSLIVEISILIKMIDNDIVGITYDTYLEKYKGILFDVVKASCQHFEYEHPKENIALGQTIRRALISPTWLTLTPPGDNSEEN